MEMYFCNDMIFLHTMFYNDCLAVARPRVFTARSAASYCPVRCSFSSSARLAALLYTSYIVIMEIIFLFSLNNKKFFQPTQPTTIPFINLKRINVFSQQSFYWSIRRSGDTVSESIFNNRDISYSEFAGSQENSILFTSAFGILPKMHLNLSLTFVWIEDSSFSKSFSDLFCSASQV